MVVHVNSETQSKWHGRKWVIVDMMQIDFIIVHTSMWPLLLTWPYYSGNIE